MAHSQRSEDDSQIRRALYAALVMRAQQGDSMAFDELFRLAYARIQDFVSSNMPAGYDAEVEDIVQQTLVNALAHINKMSPYNVEGWLYTIARHLVLDFMRYAETRLRGYIDEDSWENLLESYTLEPPDAAILSAQAAAARRAVARLRTREQSVCVVLHLMYGYSLKETAVQLGTTRAACKSLLQRARCALLKDNELVGFVR